MNGLAGLLEPYHRAAPGGGYPSFDLLGMLGLLGMGGAGTIPGPGSRSSVAEQPWTDPLRPNEGLLALAAARGGGMGGGGGIGSSGGVPSYGGEWDLDDLDLRTRNGVTLAPEAMRSLMRASRRYDLPLLSYVGTSYRDLDTQRRLYEAWKSGERSIQAAPPGKSYHNYGMAIDLEQQIPESVQDWLERQGWQNTVPNEWWHWSYGDAPWGGS